MFLFSAETLQTVQIQISLIWVHTVCVCTYVKQKTDTLDCSYFAGVLKFKSLLSLLRCYGTMIQLLSNKTTPHFQLLPMSKVDPS